MEILYSINVPNSHWLVDSQRGLKLPFEQPVNDDRWYTKPVPLFLPEGHFCPQPTGEKLMRTEASRVCCYGNRTIT